MQIDNTGFQKATLDNYLEYMTLAIQADGTFGSDFTIKKEGVVDAILTTVSNACLSLEDKFVFALKQINPYTAEGTYQDELYSLIGLLRNYATYTTVTRTIEGDVGTEIDINDLVFETPQGNQFYLDTAVTIGENGKVEGYFTAYESGSISCDESSNLKIVNAPIGVSGVYFSSGNITSIGSDYENDTQFRQRWIDSKSVMPTSKVEGGLFNALLPLCGNSKNNLVIRQNRASQVYTDFGLHTVNIIVKSSENNNTIANAIFNNIVDGVGMYGDIDVTVQDLSDEDVTISFDRAEPLDVYFNIEIVLKNNYTLLQLNNEIKNAIIDNFNYAIGEKIIANDFYKYLNDIDGIDYVTTLEISSDDDTYAQIIDTAYNEYGVVTATNITITGA